MYQDPLVVPINVNEFLCENNGSPTKWELKLLVQTLAFRRDSKAGKGVRKLCIGERGFSRLVD